MVVECNSFLVFHRPHENVLDYFLLHPLIVQVICALPAPLLAVMFLISYLSRFLSPLTV